MLSIKSNKQFKLAKLNESISLLDLNQLLYLFSGRFSKMIQINLVSF